MAATEGVIITSQAARASAAPTAEDAGSRDGVREQVRQITREAQEGAQQAARDMAKDAQREGKSVHISTDGTVSIDGNTVYTPGMPVIATGHDPFDNSHLIPQQAEDIAIGFFVMCAVMVVGWPLARAFGRRIEGRGTTPAAIPAGVADQLQRIEQAVDAMSVEVERISESQRFMAKLQQQAGGERMALPHERG
jgi:hypothetical protein